MAIRLPENRNATAGNCGESQNFKAGSLSLMSLPAGPDIALEARRRRDQVKLLLTRMTEQTNMVGNILEEAQTAGDHLTLGYESWTKYIVGEYAGKLADLDRAKRREVVGSLTAAGMSTRAIAGVVGTSHKTVVKDLQVQVVPEVPPDREDDADRLGHEDHVDRRITGRDGKSYPAHGRPVFPVVEPKKPRRPALPDQFRTAVWNLDKAIRRLEVIAADDRFDPDQETYRLHEPLLREHLNKLTNIFGAYLSDGDHRVVDEVLRGSR